MEGSWWEPGLYYVERGPVYWPVVGLKMERRVCCEEVIVEEGG